ncbi:MAG: hypothetical protein UHK54_02990 [Acutalibacteraceae bacterium]|nr:hypothetical protein [Acutalibacteraceae bacterium]
MIIVLTGSLTVLAAPKDASAEVTSKATAAKSPDTIVARASLFAAMYFFPVSGHTWIYVENLTDEPITVGIYEVPAGQGVSVGVFSFSVNDGWGIYYNLEAYRENRNNNISDCRSITKDMTRSELEKLSNTIKNYPNMWDIFIFNCTYFAFSVWNKNSDNFFIPMMIPALAMLEVIIVGAPKGVTQMYYPTKDQVFKQRGTGDNAYLEPCGEKTLSK